MLAKVQFTLVFFKLSFESLDNIVLKLRGWLLGRLNSIDHDSKVFWTLILSLVHFLGWKH